MYTVIFLDERTSDQIRDYQMLFQPALQQGKFAFCNWNSGGNDIASAVPELNKIIRGKKHWRAIILSTNSLYDDGMAADGRNPFDFSRSDDNPLPHESPVPIIRLTHILGGYPGNPVNDFEEGYEYFDDTIGETVRIAKSSLSDEQLDELMDKFSAIKSVYIEKNVSNDIQNLYHSIEEKYHFSEMRPDEILLIGTKTKSDIDEKSRLVASCKPYLESSSSQFWKTNRYPNSCRFLFSEVSRPDSSHYQQELIQFWLSVLTISSNEMSNGMLQPYRLYKLHLDIDPEKLAAYLDVYDTRLKAAEQFVQAQIDALPEYSFNASEHLLVPESIPFVMNKSDENEHFDDADDEADSEKDARHEGFGSYDAAVEAKKKAALEGIQNPRRAIDRAARTLKSKVQQFDGEQYELDQYQLDDLNEEVNALELRIFQERPCDKFKENRDSILETIQKTHDDVANMPKSMSQDIELKAGGICLGIAVIGNITYLIDSYELEGNAFIWAFVLTIALIAITAAGGFIALQMHSRKMKDVADRAIEPVRQAKAALNDSNAEFKNYFSDVCTFMKGRAMINGTQLCDGANSSERNRLNQHQTAIRSSLNRNAKWREIFAIETKENVSRPGKLDIFDIETPPHENPLYFFHTCEPEQYITTHTGEKIQIFYPFIDNITIEREVIFDTEEAY